MLVCVPVHMSVHRKQGRVWHQSLLLSFSTLVLGTGSPTVNWESNVRLACVSKTAFKEWGRVPEGESSPKFKPLQSQPESHFSICLDTSKHRLSWVLGVHPSISLLPGQRAPPFSASWALGLHVQTTVLAFACVLGAHTQTLTLAQQVLYQRSRLRII